MQKLRVLLFIHVILTVCLHIKSGNGNTVELNIAALPSWYDILHPILAARPLGAAHPNLMRFILLKKTRSDYDKIMKAISFLEDHSIHVVIGPYDEPISLATEALNISYIATTEVTSLNLNTTFQINPRQAHFNQAILDLVKHYKWDKVSVFFDDKKGMSLVQRLLTHHELILKSWRLDSSLLDRQSKEKEARDHLVHMRRVFIQKSIVICRKENIDGLLDTARSLAMLSTPYEWFYYDPGDEMAKVFNKYPDIHVNFTVFGVMPFNTSQREILISDHGFNTTLAQDTVSVLEHAVKPLNNGNLTVEDIRNTITKSIAQIQLHGKSGNIQFDSRGWRKNLSIIMTEFSGESHLQVGRWDSDVVGPFDTNLKVTGRHQSRNESARFPLIGRVAKIVTILEKPFCMYRRDHKVQMGNDKYEGFAIDLIKEVANMLNFNYEIYLVNDGKFGSKNPDGTWNGMIGELLSGNATMSVAPLSINSEREVVDFTKPFMTRYISVLMKNATMSVAPLSINSEREAVFDFTKPFMTRYISVLMKVPKSTTSYFEFLNPLHPEVWFCTLGAFVFVSINATMSVAPLSINSEREAVVDFTKPFMTRYISVLMKVPKSTTSYFEFLNPLHPEVWFCTLGAFVFVSIVLYILERVGNVNKKECPSITFKESFWFVFGSLLQGSTDASPSTLPGRILTSSWWFFALILISSYTANLAAFLTVKKINTPIKSVTDLASQTKIKYGTVKSSGIMSFFKNTDIEHFSKMWAQMSEVEPSSMVQDTEEGFRKVKEGNYAFFWDTTVNKYKTIEDCDFMEVGPPFDPKGFGIGVPPGATYREDISMAILRLSDRGTLHELENRWWGQRKCPDFAKPSTDETSKMQIDNVAGVFFILIGGVVFAAVVCLAEYFAKKVSNNVKKRRLMRSSFVAMDILQSLGRSMAADEEGDGASRDRTPNHNSGRETRRLLEIGHNNK